MDIQYNSTVNMRGGWGADILKLDRRQVNACCVKCACSTVVTLYMYMCVISESGKFDWDPAREGGPMLSSFPCCCSILAVSPTPVRN